MPSPPIPPMATRDPTPLTSLGDTWQVMAAQGMTAALAVGSFLMLDEDKDGVISAGDIISSFARVGGVTYEQACILPMSPNVSQCLPTPPHPPPHLSTSPHTSPHLPTSPPSRHASSRV